MEGWMTLRAAVWIRHRSPMNYWNYGIVLTKTYGGDLSFLQLATLW